MANTILGNTTPTWGNSRAYKVDVKGITNLTAGDSGTVFFCDQNAGSATTDNVIIILPQLSTAIAGWHGKFILQTAADTSGGGGNITIAGYGTAGVASTSGDADTINYLELADSTHALSAALDGITFPDAATKGEYIEVFCNGSEWYAYGYVSATGAATDVG